MIRQRFQRNDGFERALILMSKIMALLVLLMVAVTFIARVRGGSEDKYIGYDAGPKLIIIPGPDATDTLTKRLYDSLNLTCRVNWRPNGEKPLPQYKITWTYPNSDYVIKKQPKTVSGTFNTMTLYVPHLLPEDAGVYTCRAYDNSKDGSSETLTTAVRVSVKKNSCQGFLCPNFPFVPERCISKRFVCDGMADCPNGADERSDIANCDSEDPCKDKIRCDDGRCIPQSWCCLSSRTGPCNVTHQPSCCKRLNESLAPLEENYSNSNYPRGFVEETESQSLSHMGFLQTTIYTVIGCAMAFMFIVTILVIAICRVHMKRTLLGNAGMGTGVGVGSGLGPSVSSGVGSGRPAVGAQQGPLYDLDLYLSSHSGLLVTYNINNGVQFVGRPVDPPPYCEIVASPPREGPPPPYVSHENLPRAAAAAAEEDCEERPCHESDALLQLRQVAQPVLGVQVRQPAPATQVRQGALPPQPLQAVHTCQPIQAVHTCQPLQAVHACPPFESVHICQHMISGTSSSSTQTGNPETVPTTRSLLTGPSTIDTGTQVMVAALSDCNSSPSVSVDRAGSAVLPSVVHETSAGRLRESFIGLRERGKEEPVYTNTVGKQSTVENQPRSGSRDRSE